MKPICASNKFFMWIFVISIVGALTRASSQTTHETSTKVSQSDGNLTDETTTTRLTYAGKPDMTEARRADAGFDLYGFPSALSCKTDMTCIRYSPFYQPSCSGDKCVYFAAYKPLTTGMRHVVIHLSASKADYVAIGFTDDVRKSKTDIIACVRHGNAVVAKSYYWPDYFSTTPEEIFVSNDDLELVNGSASGPGIWCTVERAIESYDKKTKDLREKYRQVYLWGHNNDDGTPAFIDNDTSVDSWEMSMFTLSLAMRMDNNKVVPSDILPSNIDCKSPDLSCVRYEVARVPTGNCDYKTCAYHLSFMMSVQESQNWPVFLSAKNAEYVGLARTQDKSQWASTDVIGCKRLKNNTLVPFHYWVSNPKQNSKRQDVLSGLKMIQGEGMGSGLWCSLSMRINLSDDKYSNFKNPAYMLYVWGKVDKDDNPKLWTDGVVKISNDAVDLKQNSHINSYFSSTDTNSATTQSIASGAIWFFLLTSYITAFY